MSALLLSHTFCRPLQKHPNAMRLSALLSLGAILPPPSLLALLSAPAATAQSAPFGTRGGRREDDAPPIGTEAAPGESAAAAASFDVDLSGAVAALSSSADRRDRAVEAFFASPAGGSSSAEAAAGGAASGLTDAIRSRASSLSDFLTSTRRLLHRHPELMYNEQTTSAVVKKVLTDLGVDHTAGWAINTNQDRIPGPGGFGVVAHIGTGDPPCVILRADMDALPITERTEGVDDFRSRAEGKMHACGHDGHTAMLLGAAAVLKDMEGSINGTVRLVFQPAEEGGAGAKRMVEEGVVDLEPRARHAFGLHVWPTLPSGAIASRPGPLLAAAERFEVRIGGVGGHAAMPHLTVDPIVATSAIVMNLQTLVSRDLSPLESGVVSVTKVEAGDAFNVIPHSALMLGTVRALSTETLIKLRDRVEHVIKQTAETFGCNATIQYSPDYYPPTVNDPDLFEFSSFAAAAISEEGAVRDIEPTMGAEDFAFLAEAVPSTFFLLGQGSGTDPPTSYGLHHPRFALDESVLPRGVELHATLALRALKKLADEEDEGKGTEAAVS